MLIKFTILGEVASKANSRKVATVGAGEKRRTLFIKSEKARGFEKDALRQIPPKHRVRIEGPVKVTLRIFYASERSDLDESLLLDVLQDRYKRIEHTRLLVQHGVYRNDRQVREKHVYHGIDKANPRTEIEIETLVPQQQSIPLPKVLEPNPF